MNLYELVDNEPFFHISSTVGNKCRNIENELKTNTRNTNDIFFTQYQPEIKTCVERQQSSSSSSATSPCIIMSPSSPERSTITPDTTKEVVEDGDEEGDETISVDDTDVEEGEEKMTAKGDSSKESSVPKPLPCSSGLITKDGITVELVGQHLWKKFHKLGTEMIITKAGR